MYIFSVYTHYTHTHTYIYELITEAYIWCCSLAVLNVNIVISLKRPTKVISFQLNSHLMWVCCRSYEKLHFMKWYFSICRLKGNSTGRGSPLTRSWWMYWRRLFTSCLPPLMVSVAPSGRFWNMWPIRYYTLMILIMFSVVGNKLKWLQDNCLFAILSLRVTLISTFGIWYHF